MTAKKGDTVFVKSESFHHDELPGILLGYPGGGEVDVLVLPSGHSPFVMKLKEFQYSDETEGFYLTDRPYPNRPAHPPEPEVEDEPEEDDPSNDSSSLLNEEEDESETDEETSEDRDEPDSEPSVEEPKIRAPARRRR